MMIVIIAHSLGNFLFLLQNLIILKKMISFDLRLKRNRLRKLLLLLLKLKEVEKLNIVKNIKIQFIL